MNATNEMYMIYKARKDYLKKMIVNIQIMDWQDNNAKKKVITGFIEELDRVQARINDLMW